jgi:hypothetical protein
MVVPNFQVCVYSQRMKIYFKGSLAASVIFSFLFLKIILIIVYFNSIQKVTYWPIGGGSYALHVPAIALFIL